MPLGRDPGKNIEELTKVHGGEPDWPRKRIIAAGLNAARSAGGKVPALPKTPTRPGTPKGAPKKPKGARK